MGNEVLHREKPPAYERYKSSATSSISASTLDRYPYHLPFAMCEKGRKRYATTYNRGTHEKSDKKSGMICGAVISQVAAAMSDVSFPDSAYLYSFPTSWGTGPTPRQLANYNTEVLSHKNGFLFTHEFDKHEERLIACLKNHTVPIILIDWGLYNQHYVICVAWGYGNGDEYACILDYGSYRFISRDQYYYLLYNNTVGFWHFNLVEF